MKALNQSVTGVLNTPTLKDAIEQEKYWLERARISKGKEKEQALIQYNRAFMVAETKRINKGDK